MAFSGPAGTFADVLNYINKCDNAHLYDLLPIPFTMKAVRHVSQRIRRVQDFLERKIAIEIVSYYTPVAPEMEEIDFINAILRDADCDLLLDVNNIYVNSFNHHYEAKAFIDRLPLERVRYIHMAGHEQAQINDFDGKCPYSVIPVASSSQSEQYLLVCCLEKKQRYVRRYVIGANVYAK